MIRDYLCQHLPAEVNDSTGIGVHEVSQVWGAFEFVNVEGKRVLNYEARLTIEVVVDGDGKMVQIANIANDGRQAECQ